MYITRDADDPGSGRSWLRTTKRRLRGGIKIKNLGRRAEDMDILPVQAGCNDTLAVGEHELIDGSNITLTAHEPDALKLIGVFVVFREARGGAESVQTHRCPIGDRLLL